jgi:hypothetical protein
MSISLALAAVKLYLRNFYVFIKKFSQNQVWDQAYSIPIEIIEDIDWLSNQIIKNKGRTAWIPGIINIIQTDASKIGWGATFNNLKAGGSWTDHQRLFHINVLELKAIWLTLKTFGNLIKCSKVKVITDNSVSYSGIGHWYSKSDQLINLLRKIFNWCLEMEVEILQCQLISSIMNVVPDQISRQIDTGDWTVTKKVFQEICLKWGTPTIDRFADHRNHQVQRFNSWLWCPGTEGVDAFSKDWKDELNWILVPFNQFGKNSHGGLGFSG